VAATNGRAASQVSINRQKSRISGWLNRHGQIVAGPTGTGWTAGERLNSRAARSSELAASPRWLAATFDVIPATRAPEGCARVCVYEAEIVEEVEMSTIDV